MAIKFSGEFTVRKNPDEVYDFLTDPNKFAPLLPEFQSLAVQDEKHFAVKVNVGISYIKGVADVRMELSEADRPRRAQYKGQGAVAGGNVTLVASFDLAPSVAQNVAPTHVANEVPSAPDNTSDNAPNTPGVATNLLANDDGTKVNWQGEAQIFGRLASVAGGLLEPLGRKQVQKLIDGLQAALG
jgi:carbon monoxide dehydrogenase subunit G